MSSDADRISVAKGTACPVGTLWLWPDVRLSKEENNDPADAIKGIVFTLQPYVHVLYIAWCHLGKYIKVKYQKTAFSVYFFIKCVLRTCEHF